MLLALAALPAIGSAFEPQTEAVGLGGLSSDSAAWADVDGDGDPDLWDGVNLWINDGGAFTAVPVMPVGGRGVLGDVDDDGDLDLLAWHGDAVLALQTDDGWVELPEAFPATGIVQNLGRALGDFDGDGLLDLWLGAFEGAGYEPDQLYRGLGDGAFSLWWTEPATGVHSLYTKPGRGITACDFDQDADLDVYVSNYRLEPNSLWVNDGLGGFTDLAWTLGAAGIDDGYEYSFGHTIGSAWGDLDQDGDFDLFVGNFAHSDAAQDRPQFLENLGPDQGWSFADRSADAALAYQESFASPALGDFDNDGDLDLFFTTVYAGDYPILLRNDGDWRFTDVTQDQGLGGLPSTYQAAWADFDGDGDLDLVSAGELWVNGGSDHHWLQVQLQGNGLTGPVMPVGAQVRLETEAGVLARQLEVGTGEGNQNADVLHFGLGDHRDPVTLTVLWPDGSEQTLPDVAVDQQVVVAQCGDWDRDGAWSQACGGDDCDDEDAGVYPGASEAWYDDLDADCAGDSDWDADGDGWDWGGGDCDDGDAAVHPGAVETWYDGVDQDCSAGSDHDADGDGVDGLGGGDCQDADPAVYPGASERWYDGVDQDCAGDSDFDADLDGYDAVDHGGRDCDDAEPRVHPGAAEVVGNGVDEDCSGGDRTATEASGGCSAGAASGPWWVVLGLVGWGRRRSRDLRTGPHAPA